MNGGAVMTRRRAGSGVSKYTVPTAQSRAAKGSTLFQRRSTLPIWVLNLSMNVEGSLPLAATRWHS